MLVNEKEIRTGDFSLLTPLCPLNSELYLYITYLKVKFKRSIETENGGRSI